MAQNITLLGASYSDCPAILLPKTGGGTARFDDATITTATASDVASGKLFLASDGTITTGTSSGGGGGSYPWFGSGTTFVKNVLNKTINLSTGTSFDSWSASTTAGAIKEASTSNDVSETTDYENSWWFITKVSYDVAYNSGATLKSFPIHYVAYNATVVFPYPSTYQYLANGTNSAATASGTTARGGLLYYNSSGSTAYYTAAPPTYVFYLSSAPSFSLSGTTATMKLSAINARCNSTYFATSRKSSVDSAHTNISIKIDLYKTPSPNAFTSWMVESLRADMLA